MLQNVAVLNNQYSNLSFEMFSYIRSQGQKAPSNQNLMDRVMRKKVSKTVNSYPVQLKKSSDHFMDKKDVNENGKSIE